MTARTRPAPATRPAPGRRRHRRQQGRRPRRRRGRSGPGPPVRARRLGRAGRGDRPDHERDPRRRRRGRRDDRRRRRRRSRRPRARRQRDRRRHLRGQPRLAAPPAGPPARGGARRPVPCRERRPRGGGRAPPRRPLSRVDDLVFLGIGTGHLGRRRPRRPAPPRRPRPRRRDRPRRPRSRRRALRLRPARLLRDDRRRRRASPARARAAIEAGEPTDASPRIAEPTAADVFAAAEAGDLAARPDRRRAPPRAIARMVHELVLAYDVELVVIGGGISRAGAPLLERDPGRARPDRSPVALCAELLPRPTSGSPAGDDASGRGAHRPAGSGPKEVVAREGLGPPVEGSPAASGGRPSDMEEPRRSTPVQLKRTLDPGHGDEHCSSRLRLDRPRRRRRRRPRRTATGGHRPPASAPPRPSAAASERRRRSPSIRPRP